MADSKITALTATTSPALTDIMPIVTDPSGSAATKKVTLANLLLAFDKGARVYNSGNIAISNNTVTALTFDSERYDTDTIHDTSTNTGRLTCKTAGKYIIIANVQWASNATGYREVDLRLNGATFISSLSDAGHNLSNNSQITSTIYNLAVNDYVEVIVLQTSGGNLNVVAGANYSPEFMMQRIG